MKNRIKILRQENNMTINEVANKLNINPSTIQRYENGTINPPLDKLMILSDLFDCSIDYLIYISDKKNINEIDNFDQLAILIETNPDTKKIFIHRIIDLMLKKDITKEILYKKTKLSKNIINNYIKGKEFPNIDNLKKIALSLNTTIDFLVGLNDNSEPDEIVILEDWIGTFKGHTKKISQNDIRKFLEEKENS
ncbi:MAG: helix-turn-helix transcriptional regulator [Clostridiales bacterium]